MIIVQQFLILNEYKSVKTSSSIESNQLIFPQVFGLIIRAINLKYLTVTMDFRSQNNTEHIICVIL